jgi:hypothetical protein|tara:strand:- start:26 stop:424 length:399 start_codon:yes stop_codon:yes gene_type:complete
MANGTIAFDTLSTSGQISGTAVSVDADYLAYGSAKCWHLMDHAGGSTLDSFNVTSFTDQATGHYRTVIASDMANANYVTTGSNVQGDTEYYSCLISDGDVNTATNCDYKIVNMNSTINDNDIINVVIHGDLA